MSNTTKFNKIFYSTCLIIIVSVVSTTILPDILYFTRMTIINNMSLIYKGDEEEDEEKNILKPIDMTSIALPFGIDRNLHMNNARFVYELNFSRRHFFNKLGIWKILKEKNMNCIVVSQTIRYRKEIKIFQLFTIQSKILDWDDDENCIYIETRFISKKDKFVIAIHHCKYKLVGNKILKNSKYITADIISPTNLLLEAKLITKDYQKDKNYFIKYWELGNELNSNELNPNKRSKVTKITNTTINRKLFDTNDDELTSLSLSGLTPVKTVMTPVK